MKENPDKTEADFKAWKALSDEIFYEEDRAENAKTKRNAPLYVLDKLTKSYVPSLDDTYIKNEELKEARSAVNRLFKEGKLTEKQKSRFILHICYGLSLREIARRESKHFTSVCECFNRAKEKLQKYYNEGK